MATVIEISATKVHASPTRALSSQPEDATSSKPSDAPSSRTLITPSFTHSTARFLPATSLSTLKSRHSKLGFSTAIKHHSFTTALLPPAHTTVRPAVLVPAIAPSQSAQPIDNNIHSAPFWMLWLCIPVIICLLGFAVTVYYKFSFRPHLKCQEQLQSRRSYLNHGSNTWIHPRNVLGARSERADHMGRQSNGASLASSTIFPAVQRRVAGVLPSRTELRDCRGLEKFPRQEQVHPIQAEATVQPRMAGQRFYVPQGTRALDHTVPRHSIGLGIEHPRRPGDGRTLKIDPGHYHSPAQPDYSVDTMGVLPPFCGRRESPELAGVFGSLDGGGNIQLSEMRGGGTPWLRSNFALDSPAYASGSALASPTPISSPQHRQYPLQPETCAHPELPLDFSNSQMRRRHQVPPQIHVNTHLANAYAPDYYSCGPSRLHTPFPDVDLESQLQTLQPKAPVEMSRSWLTLPNLANGSNSHANDSSRPVSRTHSRSSSASSLLSTIVNGVADKIVKFTNDEGGAEDGLLLPISSKERRQASGFDYDAVEA